MSIQSDVVTALTAIAGGRVFPEAAPQNYALPMVIFVRTARDPVNMLDGTVAMAKYTFVFECYANTKAAALALADQVRAAVQACLNTTLTTQFEEPVSSETYEPQVAEFMEPVQFAFWV